MKVQFSESKTVDKLVSGRTRDDSFDGPVKTAYENKGKVYETTVKNEDVEEYRKGLQRSALFLGIGITTDFEDKGDGKTVVRFVARDKQSRPRKTSATVENTDAPAGAVETAKV